MARRPYTFNSTRRVLLDVVLVAGAVWLVNSAILTSLNVAILWQNILTALRMIGG